MKNQTTISTLLGIILPREVPRRAILPAVGSILFVTLFASLSQAQQRTFVSGLGSDSNPCTRTAPCRTFTQAISLTNAGGEVVVLDSAGYGAFAITKAVTVQAPPGVYAGITVFSGDGITINAGAADTVVLRGLTVNNQGSSGNGIIFNTGGTLQVESCVISGFNSGGSGLSFIAAATLEVKDSIMRGNGDGIGVQPASGTASASIDHVRLEGNSGSGVFAREGSRVTVSNSIASANGGGGFVAVSQSTAPVQLNLEACVASNNVLIGILAESTSTGIATVRVSDSIVTDNGVGLNNQGSPALLLSRGNNTVEGNGINTSGTIGSYTPK